MRRFRFGYSFVAEDDYGGDNEGTVYAAPTEEAAFQAAFNEIRDDLIRDYGITCHVKISPHGSVIGDIKRAEIVDALKTLTPDELNGLIVEVQSVSSQPLPEQYIIMKASRVPANPDARTFDAYSGPSCADAGIEPRKVYDSPEAAQADIEKLNRANGVGWSVWQIGDTKPLKGWE